MGESRGARGSGRAVVGHRGSSALSAQGACSWSVRLRSGCRQAGNQVTTDDGTLVAVARHGLLARRIAAPGCIYGLRRLLRTDAGKTCEGAKGLNRGCQRSVETEVKSIDADNHKSVEPATLINLREMISGMGDLVMQWKMPCKRQGWMLLRLELLRHQAEDLESVLAAVRQVLGRRLPDRSVVRFSRDALCDDLFPFVLWQDHGQSLQ